MKRKLTFLIAVICSITAFAQWEKPVPKLSPVAFGETMYIYNVDMKKFLNQYSSSPYYAVLNDNGISVIVEKHMVNDAWDGKTVTIKDYMTAKEKWYNLYFYSEQRVSVYGSSANNAYWSLETAGDNYTLSLASNNADFYIEDYEGSFFGYDASNTTNKYLAPFLFTSENDGSHRINWNFVTEKDYNDYLEKFNVFSTAEQLGSLIETAQDRGLDVSSVKSVYDNTSSTTAELLAAIETITSIIAADASPSNPMDLTNKLVNPTFDDGTISGWESTKQPTMTATGVPYMSVGLMDLQQQITGLPNGIYLIDVQAYSKMSGTDNELQLWKDGAETNAWLFAESSSFRGLTNIMHAFADAATEDPGCSTSVREGLYIPATSGTPSKAFFDLGHYHNQVMCLVEDGTLTIGMYKYEQLSSDFTAVDNFTLKYLGAGYDSYDYWRKEVLAEKYKADDKSLCQTAAQESYEATYNAFINASTINEIKSALDALLIEFNQYQDNINAYANYQAAINDAQEALNNVDDDELGDYIIDSDNILYERSLSTDEMIEETEKLKTLIANAYLNGMKAGTDCTKLLNNPDFTNGWTGWTIDPEYDTPEGKFSYTNPLISASKVFFNISQTVNNLTPGVYKLKVQACTRAESATNEALQTYLSGNVHINAFIYANGSEAPVCSMYDYCVSEKPATGTWSSVGTEEEPAYILNSSTSAMNIFAMGLMECEVYCVVGDDGKLTVGIYNIERDAQSSYTLFDNFRLEYEAYDEDIVNGIINDLITKANVYVNSEDAYSKKVKEAMKAEIDAASEAMVDGSTSKEIITHMEPLKNAIESCKASIKEYSNLRNSLTELKQVFNEFKDKATPEAIENAEKVESDMSAAIANKDVETESIIAMVENADAAKSMLRIPNNYADASDATPIDFTCMIVNPNYDDNDAKTGWTYTASPAGNEQEAEYFDKTFNYNQALYGLPAGTYKLTVQAFYRYGGYAENAESFTNGQHKYLASMYANEYSVPIRSIFDYAASVADGAFTTETTLGYVPNTMAEAAACFSQTTEDGTPYYLNELYFEVKEDGSKMIIGLSKEESKATDWLLFDSWTLTYYGKNSNHDANNISDITTDANTSSIEIYSINGIRKSSLSKGVNIVKRTQADGTLKVSKILVK